ncbi:MAG: type III pantothenate kinase [Cyanobacteria bacterium J06649_4]
MPSLFDASETARAWLALVIGNTRLHWGYFDRSRLLGTWHTPHLTSKDVERLTKANFQLDAWSQIAARTMDDVNHVLTAKLPIADVWMASVVPAQAELWTNRSQTNQSLAVETVLRSHIPINGLYPTLGIDRAVTLLGAGETLGWPILVIDAGTALTFTAGIISSEHGRDSLNTPAHRVTLKGGAILPGLRLQAAALGQGTAALSSFAQNFTTTDLVSRNALPARWALDSVGAITSGITYSLLSTLVDYLGDWWEQYPTGYAVLTGGDAPFLHRGLTQRTPEIASRVQVNQVIMFYGVQAYREHRLSSANND